MTAKSMTAKAMTAKLKTAVLGATGYSGLELTRILVHHPQLAKPALLSRNTDNGGATDLAEVFPALSGNGGYPAPGLSCTSFTHICVTLHFISSPLHKSLPSMP